MLSRDGTGFRAVYAEGATRETKPRSLHPTCTVCGKLNPDAGHLAACEAARERMDAVGNRGYRHKRKPTKPADLADYCL